MKKPLIGILTASLLSLTTISQACTDFKISAIDGSIVVARSLEFATDLKSNVRTSNRNREFTGAPDSKAQLSWKAKYGYVFLDGLGVDATVDGINEAGLSFEALYLPGEAQYQTAPVNQEKISLGYMHLGDWILSNFKTVDEVRHGLSKIYVVNEKLAGLGDMIFPLHFSIFDASGKGIVVEYVKGVLNVYDNTVGVMTNSPTYDWHVTNLRNYINLSPFNPNPVTVGNLVFNATGQGAGMKGMPGDVSPPSRFVKMSVMKDTLIPSKNAAEALNVAQHLMNNVDIPLGYVRAKQNDQVVNELTQWAVFKDLKNKVFYYRTYNDTTLHAINLTQLDLSENAPRLKMPIADDQYIVDVTKQFLGSKSQ